MPRAVTAILVAGLLGLAGCGDDDEPAATAPVPIGVPTQTTATATEGATRTVGIYLLRDDEVAPVAAEVERTAEVGRAALEALLAETDDTAIEPGTQVDSLEIDGGTAAVSFAPPVSAGTPAAAQVVHTLTRLPTVQRVSLQGGAPETRESYEEHAPQILIESPLPGARVASPLDVVGTANTFEATFQLELLGPGGDELAADFVTASAGSGTRGTFEHALEFDAASGAELTLYAYEASAQDGSPLHEVRIPLVVR